MLVSCSVCCIVGTISEPSTRSASVQAAVPCAEVDLCQCCAVCFRPVLLFQNPAPGLQVFQAPMPYAEVDPEFHLCPLPRYFRQDYDTNPHASTQRKYLDREVSRKNSQPIVISCFRVL